MIFLPDPLPVPIFVYPYLYPTRVQKTYPTRTQPAGVPVLVQYPWWGDSVVSQAKFVTITEISLLQWLYGD